MPKIYPKKLVIIVDYNLSRVEDVKILALHARSAHQLATVLIRPNAGEIDRQLADFVIDLNPLGEKFVEEAVAAVLALGTPVAVLPFSDNAVATGAALAEALGTRADSAQLAQAAFSKLAYREAEARYLQFFPDRSIMGPKWGQVKDIEGVRAFARSTGGGMVIKPSCEGNNRGVVKIGPEDDVAGAFKEAAEYLAGGVLCEEIIRFPEEYSYDGIGTLSFVTQKSSASGRYPVEYGQTVPARLSEQNAQQLAKAGDMANLLVGQRHGPFHNEVKLDPVTGRVAVIEPNRRPGGMRIWHLAAKVYGINFFKLWVDVMTGSTNTVQKLEAKGIASIRMLGVPKAGTLQNLPSQNDIFKRLLAQPKITKLTLAHGLEWFDFSMSMGNGAQVSEVIDDNSKFIGHICVYSPASDADIHSYLDILSDEWKTFIANFINPTVPMPQDVFQGDAT